MMWIIGGLAGGFVLGLRFKVLALGPAVVLVMMVIGAGGVSWSQAGHVLLASAAINLGYLGGIITYALTARGRELLRIGA
jgi:hypothetical protein